MTRARSRAEYDAIQAHINSVDEIARRMEAKWGAGRLPVIVPPDLAAKFDSQLRKMNEAVWEGDVYDVEVHAGAMYRAWTALDDKATELGCEGIDPRTFEFVCDDGSVFVVCADGSVASEVARRDDGRKRRVYSVRELETLMAGHDVDKFKSALPGCEVKSLKKAPRAKLVDDELPEIFTV